MSELTCTKMIKSTITKGGSRLGKDNEGRQMYEHRRCGKPASEHEIGGMLTKAKSVLCNHHKKQADRESFTSKNGYAYGRIEKRAKDHGYDQERFPGTGVIA